MQSIGPEKGLPLSEIAATALGLMIPLAWMSIRWFTGMAAFPAYLAGWILLEATVHTWLIGLVHRERLTIGRFRLFYLLASLILGIPATVMCVYMGIVPEFRLLPLFFLLLRRSGWSQTVLALGLFFAGMLIFFPFFSGNPTFLAMELFRPLAGLCALFALTWAGRRYFKLRHRRILRIRRQTRTKL